MRSSGSPGKARAFAVVLSIGLLAGCAVPAYRSGSPFDVPGAPQAIAVVVRSPTPAGAGSPSPPGTPTDGTAVVPETVLGGAVAGAAAGSWLGLWAGPLVLLLAGPQALVAAPALGAIVAGGAALGAIGGAAAGAAFGLGAEQAAALQRATEDVTNRAEVSAAVATAIVEAVPAVSGLRATVVAAGTGDPTDPAVARMLRAQGYGSVVELQLPLARFVGGAGGDAPVVMMMTANARWIDTADGRVLSLRSFLVATPPAATDAWTRDTARLARRETRRLCETLAERIVETFVLQTALSVGPDAAGTPHACGVVPRRPKAEWDWRGRPQVASVDSRNPVLAWGHPPGPPDVHAVPANATDFRYDLRVWQLRDDGPVDLVYQRMGIEEPSHRVETRLDGNATYGWSVRVRYMLDGRPRAVRWSAWQAPLYAGFGIGYGRPAYAAERQGELRLQPCEAEDMTPCGCLDFIPPANMWKFATP